MNIFERYAYNINKMQAPGLPENKIAIFVNRGQEGADFYNENGYFEVSEYINRDLLPWAFYNGISLSGNTHGNFVITREYEKAEDLIEKTEEDYSLAVEYLNYTYAVMSAASEWYKNWNTDVKKIVLILYAAEAGTSVIREFNTEQEFEEAIREELEYLEEE